MAVVQDGYFLLDCLLPPRCGLFLDFLGVALLLPPPDGFVLPFLFPFRWTLGERERDRPLCFGELIAESFEVRLTVFLMDGVFVWLAPPRPRRSFFAKIKSCLTWLDRSAISLRNGFVASLVFLATSSAMSSGGAVPSSSIAMAVSSALFSNSLFTFRRLI